MRHYRGLEAVFYRCFEPTRQPSAGQKAVDSKGLFRPTVVFPKYGCAIAAGYILNALAPIPPGDSQAVLNWMTANVASYTAETQSVIDYMAANAGVAANK